MKNYSLVTGASGGIGLDIARLLAKDKHDLILVARSEDKLKEAKECFESDYGTKVKVIVLDLSLPDAAKKLYDALQKEEIQIDILINNAGFGDYGLYADCDWEKQERMINLNVLTLSKLTRLLLPAMIKAGEGRIMNVASVVSFLPGPLMATYYATKAFVLSFSCSLASELRGTGVTVTALCPGPVDTGFVAASSLEESKLFRTFKPKSAAEVARYGFRRMMNGKRLGVPGILNKLMITMVRFSPRGLVAGMVKMVQEKVHSN